MTNFDNKMSVEIKMCFVILLSGQVIMQISLNGVSFIGQLGLYDGSLQQTLHIMISVIGLVNSNYYVDLERNEENSTHSVASIALPGNFRY